MVQKGSIGRCSGTRDIQAPGHRVKKNNKLDLIPGIVMSDVFLSYSRENRNQVEQLAEAFREAGMSVWWDYDIGTGAHFDTEIDDALKGARCIVVAWSTHSVDSDWVRSEAHAGFDRGILVPALLDEVIPPLPFTRMQAANLSGWPDAARSSKELARLLDGVRRILDSADADSTGKTASVSFSGIRKNPAIAVLPLTDHSGDPDDEYLADGITEDIITRLQRFRTFPIISRHSVFAYKGREYDLPKIARELDVKYLVVGKMRKLGNRLRIIIDLIETNDFHTVSSEKYDREIDDIFDLQDEISLVTAAMLQPEIERSERRRELPSRSESIASWHLVRRGLWHQYKLTREDAAEAKRYFELALDQEPDSVEALVQMGWWHWWDLSQRRGMSDDWSSLTRYAKRASVLDPKDSRARQLTGIAIMMAGDPATALKIFKEAIELNPCNALAYDSLGSAYEVMGEAEKALEALDTAIRLSPFDLWVFHARGERACAYYALGELDDAIDEAERALNLRPGYWLAHMIKTVALVRAGRMDMARKALGQLLACRPDFGDKDIRWIGYTDPARTENIFASLREAGWQPLQAEK